MSSSIDLDLNDLERGLPGVTPALGNTHKEACLVRFSGLGHASGVKMRVLGDRRAICNVTWSGEVTNQMQAAYADKEVTTESAAYGVSFLLVRSMSDFTVIEKSFKGTGFDYWLGKEQLEEHPPFTKEARLEVSGIMNGSDSTVKRRVREKFSQVDNPAFNMLPVVVSVVEFSQPVAHFGEKAAE